MESQEESLLGKDQTKKTDCVKFLGMVFIGIINNIPYWVAFSSAQSICTHFKKDGYIGAVSWGIVFLSIFATVGNTFLSSRNVSYTVRSIINGTFMVVGLIGTAFAPNIYVAICTIALVGVSSDFGEGVMLGYFAVLNDDSLLNAWGVGTGFSGLIGSGYSLLCQYYSIPYFYSFICMAPCGVLYPLIFHFMLKPKKDDTMTVTKSITSIDNLASYESIEEKAPFCSCSNITKAIRYIINNFLNFMFQYVALEGLSDCSMTHEEKETKSYIFGIFSISYQFGGFLARTFTKWLVTSKLELITICTCLSFTAVLLNDIFDVVPPIYLTIPLCLDGFFGGLSYMSIFDTIMKQAETTKKDREIITNYVSVSIGGSIQIASLFIILMQNTFLKKQCIR